MKEALRITRSKDGYPCLWEHGGGYGDFGNAQIITDTCGGPPLALYIRHHGDLACNRHALIPVMPGMYVIFARHYCKKFTITIDCISHILHDDIGEMAAVCTVSTYRGGEWTVAPPANLLRAIAAAKNKACDYHCRAAYWVDASYSDRWQSRSPKRLVLPF